MGLYQVTIGIIALSGMLAIGCGSGLPAEVEEARTEAVEAADAEYDAANRGAWLAAASIREN